MGREKAGEGGEGDAQGSLAITRSYTYTALGQVTSIATLLSESFINKATDPSSRDPSQITRPLSLGSSAAREVQLGLVTRGRESYGGGKGGGSVAAHSE